jgi:hypothetical protein
MNFASTLPSLCAQTLFLGLNLTDQPKPWLENPASAVPFVVVQHIATAVPGPTAINNPAPNAAPTMMPAKSNLLSVGSVAVGLSLLF